MLREIFDLLADSMCSLINVFSLLIAIGLFAICLHFMQASKLISNSLKMIFYRVVSLLRFTLVNFVRFVLVSLLRFGVVNINRPDMVSFIGLSTNIAILCLTDIVTFEIIS